MNVTTITLEATALRRLSLTVLVGLAMAAALPAHALGRLVDVQLQDRDTGETLHLIRHNGDYWVAGRSGARYAVSVRNRSSARVLGVVSVDGVNVISGETASWEQTGYVLHRWQQYAITGWRKSDHEVAAFHFTASLASYAARTGRPDHMGVIGVAVFREKHVPPVMTAPPVESPRYQPESGNAPARERLEESRAAPSATPQSKSLADSAESAGDLESANAMRRRAPATPAPRLGTGHGERERSTISHTAFERRSDRPDEIIRIRYDSLENLVAMGIVPAAVTPPRPNPFPGQVQPGYAPDPS